MSCSFFIQRKESHPRGVGQSNRADMLVLLAGTVCTVPTEARVGGIGGDGARSNDNLNVPVDDDDGFGAGLDLRTVG